jgi:arginyl-tRNA synthetase
MFAVYQEITKALEAAGIKDAAGKLEEPPQSDMGDVAYPCFTLAKEQKRNPQDIAAGIVEKIMVKLPAKSFVVKVDAKAGYVNFFLDWAKIAGGILDDATKESYGSSPKKKSAVVEFASPNPAHPIHIGSARSMLIGESLSRILDAAGYRVSRLCYINDLGKQVAVLTYGYEKFIAAENKKMEPDKKPDHWLLGIYIKANEAIAQNPNVETEVAKILKNAESNDKNTVAAVKKLVGICLEGFEQTFARVKIKFDKYLFESDFADESKKYIAQMKMRKLLFDTEDGAKIINLEKFGLPSTVILRKDGTGLYLTRDIAGTLYKFEKYNPDLNIYVVSEDQKLHFAQQFKILELLGHEDFAKKCVHIGYGYVSLPEGKMSSRIGRVVLIDDVFDEAAKKIKEQYKSDTKAAEAIGVGAVVYSILKIEPKTQVSFDWTTTLAMEGNTGPYIQYAHTRCCSILKKSKNKKIKNISVKNLGEQEKQLLKKLSQFPEVVKHAAKDLRPHYVCNYAYELATAFNNFYQNCPVLTAGGDVKNFRLGLVAATKNVLAAALNLIVMEALEKM